MSSRHSSLLLPIACCLCPMSPTWLLQVFCALSPALSSASCAAMLSALHACLQSTTAQVRARHTPALRCPTARLAWPGHLPVSGWLAGWLATCLLVAGLLAGWHVSWLAGWLAGSEF